MTCERTSGDCRTRAGNVGAGSAGAGNASAAIARFDRMIEHCLAHACAARAAGRPIVGILCEYTPRELILAGGGVPVCLCGGSAATIPAAESELPANLCPLIKSTYGYHLQGANPFLEMADLVVAETTCDGKKKMYELMAERREMLVLELPQRPDQATGLAQWRAELERLRGALAARWEVEISDARLRDAIGLMNRERALRRRLAGLMRRDDPPLTGLQLLALKSSIACIPEDLACYQAIIDELEPRAPECEAPRPASRPVRVLLTGVPVVHGAERVVELIEARGGLVVAMENCTGLKPILEDVDEAQAAHDPIGALAAKYYHLPCSVMSRNDARLDLLASLASDYRAECVIELIWQACLTYDVESARVRRAASETLGLPYLKIETDYTPSDSARIAVRVEALFETVRGARERSVFAHAARREPS